MVNNKSISFFKLSAKTAVILISLVCICLLVSCSEPTPELPTIVPTAIVQVPDIATQAVTTAVPTLTSEPGATPVPPLLVSSLSPLALNISSQFSTTHEILDMALIDLTGGGLPDIVASTLGQEVYAGGLDGSGFTSPFTNLITIVAGGDMDGDTVGDVFLAGNDQTVSVKEADMNGGIFITRHTQPTLGQVSAITTFPVNNQQQLVVGTDSGNIQALNIDFAQQWLVPPPSAASVTHLLSLPAAGADPLLIAAYGDGQVAALTVTGDQQWTQNLDAPITAVVPADIDQNTSADMIVGDQQGQVRAIDSAGEELWRWSADAPVKTLLALDDGRDGNPVVLVGSGDTTGTLTVLDKDGLPIWQAPTGHPPQAMTAADLDENGRLDIVVGTSGGDLLIFDTDGNLRSRKTLSAPISHLMTVNSHEILAVAGSTIYTLDVTPSTITAELPAPPDLAETTIIPTSPATAVPLAPPPFAQTRPHYDILVDLDYANHTAVVTQTITIPNNSRTDWNEVVFHAAPAYWPGFLDLQNIALMPSAQETITLTPTITSTMIHLPLPTPILAGESASMQFNYQLTLPRLDPLGWGPVGNAGWGPDLIQMGDWYPSLVPYDAETEEWRTWEYTPVGDPVRTDLADYSVQIITSPNMTVAAPGYTNTIDDMRHYHLENGRAFAFLASPNYVYLEGSSQGKPIRIYVLKEHQALAPVVLNTATQALTLFHNRFGPYPHDELIIAENGFLTAMEYSSIISLSGFAFDEYNDTPQTLLTPITAHEVAHQYWYSAVGNDQVLEPWLDESLAMLAEFIYYETYYPDYEAWWWQYRVRRWQSNGYVDATIYDYSNSPDFVHEMYSQAADFIYDLREEMGEVNFNNFIRSYYQQHQNQTVTTNDFFELAQSYTNVDLAPLVSRYFENMPTVLSSSSQ